jgi:Flp pilus assembly protein TadG
MTRPPDQATRTCARPRTCPCARPRTRRDDAGTVTAFTMILVLAVLAFAGLVLDAGLAIATKVQAVSSAQSAARAGARELDVAALRTSATIRLDPARATAAARNWLNRAGATGTVTVTPDTVTVTITTARRTQLLHLVGLTSIPVTATATAQAVRP